MLRSRRKEVEAPERRGDGSKRYLAKRVLKNWHLEKGRAVSPGHLAF